MPDSELDDIMREREIEAARARDLGEKIGQALDMLSGAVERLDKTVTSLNAKIDALALRAGQIDGQ